MDDQQKRAIIADAWHMKGTAHVPYIVEVGRPHLATLEYWDNDANELAWNIDYHRSLREVIDYNIPNIKPNVGIGIVASAIGCETVPNNEADPWIKPLINESTVDRVYDLRKPDINTCEVYDRAFKRLSYLQSHSSLPLRMLNVPSPLVVASQVCEYTSFVESTITHPNEVHHLMELVTASVIEYLQQQLRRIRNLYTAGHEPFYIPKEIGIRISDDTAAIMSPNGFKKYGLPYNSLIAREFHGLIWHSCGDVTRVLPAVLETPELRGVDIVLPQNNWEKLKAAIEGRAAILARHYYWDHSRKEVDLLDYSRQILDYFGRDGVLILTSTPTLPDAVSLSTQLRGLCEG